MFASLAEVVLVGPQAETFPAWSTARNLTMVKPWLVITAGPWIGGPGHPPPCAGREVSYS